MAKEFARAFYNSKRWKDCRRAYIAKRISIDGGMCETYVVMQDNINEYMSLI